MYPLAKQVSERLLPRTRAYHEIWLDEERVAGSPAQEDAEPIYGRTYLPRKFKIAFAVPPVNDVDVYTQDIGFIAIADGDELVGFNVCVGGGMGRTDNEPATYPRLGDVIGFCLPEQAVEIAEKIVTIQRDFGDRTERKHARMKYTIDDRGLDWFQAELERRLGWGLASSPALPLRYQQRPHGMEFGDRRHLALHAVHRERPGTGRGKPASDECIARNCAGPRRRFPADAEPEFDYRQYRRRSALADQSDCWKNTGSRRDLN